MSCVKTAVPFEHFLISTGLDLDFSGGFDGENYRLNVVIRRDGVAADICDGHICKGVVGFAKCDNGEQPTFQSAIDDLISVISEQILNFKGFELKVPRLKS